MLQRSFYPIHWPTCTILVCHKNIKMLTKLLSNQKFRFLATIKWPYATCTATKRMTLDTNETILLAHYVDKNWHFIYENHLIGWAIILSVVHTSLPGSDEKQMLSGPSALCRMCDCRTIELCWTLSWTRLILTTLQPVSSFSVPTGPRTSILIASNAPPHPSYD